MTEEQNWLPLFPLNAVLFPDGILPLKVFEARYVDMLTACMRHGKEFGVVLIRHGQEVGPVAEPEEVGCTARVLDCDMHQAGVMLVRVEGCERFRILETRVRANQLLEARTMLLPPDRPAAPGEKHVQCAKALQIVIDDIEQRGRAAHGASYVSPFCQGVRLDDAGWVAARWCEILPIPLQARQKLLELEDADTRLSLVYEYLRQHEII